MFRDLADNGTEKKIAGTNACCIFKINLKIYKIRKYKKVDEFFYPVKIILGWFTRLVYIHKIRFKVLSTIRVDSHLGGGQ